MIMELHQCPLIRVLVLLFVVERRLVSAVELVLLVLTVVDTVLYQTVVVGFVYLLLAEEGSHFFVDVSSKKTKLLGIPLHILF